MVCSVKAALRSACWIFCTLAHESKNLDEDCRLLPFRFIRPAVCEIRGKILWSPSFPHPKIKANFSASFPVSVK